VINNLKQNSKIGKVNVAVKANTSTAIVNHEFRDSHVANFTVFVVLKPPMKQLHQVDYTVPSPDERSSFCWNRELDMTGHVGQEVFSIYNNFRKISMGRESGFHLSQVPFGGAEGGVAP